VDPDRFWSIIDSVDSPSALHDNLKSLTGDDLLAFERLHAAYMDRAYDWSLWGAAYVIAGGCSDDLFEYFRAYLISRGQQIFERAVTAPDSLADVTLDTDDEWEDWMSPTMFVVHERTGQWAYVGPPDPQRPRRAEPSGEPWNESDLAKRFPRLASRYGL
jgi:Protein of unknown function (DUF4240)